MVCFNIKLGLTIQGINRSFVLSFPKAKDQDSNRKKGHSYYMFNARIINHNVIDR